VCYAVDMTNQAAVELGKRSWEVRKRKIDNPSEYFRNLKLGKTKKGSKSRKNRKVGKTQSR